MSDERWTIEDDAAAAIAAYGIDHPMTTALAFWQGINDLPTHREALGALVTPESRSAWGDFSEIPL
ncbi:hypothetical protein [Agromyces sp. NPDC057865]|uniref:hypothetical protein n=1 Tax=Agromyces sp. NPDC057865 TaxID=3346267 RepID=UPI003670CDE9